MLHQSTCAMTLTELCLKSLVNNVELFKAQQAFQVTTRSNETDRLIFKYFFIYFFILLVGSKISFLESGTSVRWFAVGRFLFSFLGQKYT